MPARERLTGFVVVEGTTWVGKSTVARSLSRSLGAKLFHLPPEFMRFRKSFPFDDWLDPASRIAYYVGAGLHMSQLVRDELTRGPVVCDRYMASPLGLVEADAELSPNEVETFVAPFEANLARPDVTLLLVADQRAVLDRVAAHAGPDRRIIGLHRRALGSEDHFLRWEQATRRLSARLGPVAEIDTAAMTVRRMTGTALGRVMDHLRVAHEG